MESFDALRAKIDARTANRAESTNTMKPEVKPATEGGSLPHKELDEAALSALENHLLAQFQSPGSAFDIMVGQRVEEIIQVAS